MQLCCRDDREHDTIKIPNCDPPSSRPKLMQQRQLATISTVAVQNDVHVVAQASTSGSDGSPASSNERPKFPQVCMDLPLPEGAVHFDVELSKIADQPLGLILDGRFTLMGVEGGAAQEYQNLATEDKLLQPNDWIAAVNGDAGSRCHLMGLMRVIKDNDPVVLSIVRVRPIQLIVSQFLADGAPPLGLGFVYHNFAHYTRAPNSFDILSIGEGAIMEYNRLARPHRRLLVDDRVISVNGKRGSAEMLLESMRNSKSNLKIDILRFPAICLRYR